ncbi:MAG: enoyl-CoA hydratase [Ramlibacter sp.]|nr:enoyl-CoA hydratase [Ramlibacter sp.]
MFTELAQAYTLLDGDAELPVGVSPLPCAAPGVTVGWDCRFSQLELKRGIMATGGATLPMAERAGLAMRCCTC